MGRNSKIEYVDATHNFWVGCTPVSPACENCFARTITTRFGQDFSVVQRAQRFDEPTKWKTPKRILTCSMSDFFHKDADKWREEAWDIIAKTPHTYLILTKRAERISLPKVWCGGMGKRPKKMPVCPRNVHLGATVENQEQLEKRWGHLNMHPAPVWFLSIEPMLGPINFERAAIKVFGRNVSGLRWRTKVHWVIVGGESGPKARPMHPEWVRSIRDQCNTARVPLFFKQWGEYSLDMPSDFGKITNTRYSHETRTFFPDGRKYDYMKPDQLLDEHCVMMFKVGKEKAGRILDGRKWNEMPK